MLYFLKPFINFIRRIKTFMTEVYQKAFSLILEERKNKQSGVYAFFQSLLYGSLKQPSQTNFRHLNVYTQRTSDCLIYLHQQHIGILVCVDKLMTGIRLLFNIKNISISEFNSYFELHHNIQKNKYLVIKEKYDCLVLIFDDTASRNFFKDNLQKLKKIMSQIPDFYDPIILKAFIKADSNQNGQISWTELKNLVRMMKINLNKGAKDLIKKILGKQKIETIQFSEFEKLWKIFYCRNELVEVFQKYNREQFYSLEQYLSPKLGMKEFQRFLIEEQKQTQEDTKRIIAGLYYKQNCSLSFYDFCHYIFGPTNNLLNGKYKMNKVDMGRPLNHYYCYSSHNTYLTGDQLFSDSRVQRYLVDLQNGLRCVEIDIHDSSQGPIVKHGYTPTSSIFFKDVIQSIRRFVDLNPKHTPIILSLQVHCSNQNQQKIADILREKFPQKQKIIIIDTSKSFPTLMQCMGKIIIKGPGDIELFRKNQKQMLTLDDGYSSEQDKYQNSFSEQQNENKLQQQQNFSTEFKQVKQDFLCKVGILKEYKRGYNQKKNEFRKVKKQPIKIRQILYNEKQKMVEMVLIANKQNQKYHKKHKVNGKLLSIISMLSKGKLQSECQWESNSFSQSKLKNFYSDQITFQKLHHLSFKKWFRSYPDGMRILSSNYDPLPALQLGVQIVAINTQSKNDINSHILKSFFTKGIQQVVGYREKFSKSQRSKIDSNKIKITQSMGQNHNQGRVEQLTKIQVKFISGLRIYQNEDDMKTIPAVEVKAYFLGTRRDNQLNSKHLASKQFTETIQNEAFNPRFLQSQPIEIKCLDPEFGFLVVEVPQCGRSVLPVDCIRPGWRVLSLYDEELKEKQSKLLCHVELNHTTIQIKA